MHNECILLVMTLYAFVQYTIWVLVRAHEHLYGVRIHGGQWYVEYAHTFCTGNRYLTNYTRYLYGTKAKQITENNRDLKRIARLLFTCRK